MLTFCHKAADANTLAPAVAVVAADSTSANTVLFEPETLQLTDEIVTNLTAIGLANATLFDFDDVNATTLEEGNLSCKVFPGDAAWPSTLTWWILDLLLGERLITTIPSAASCYNGWPSVEDATECTYVTNEWTNSSLHMNDPTSVMWPLYQGRKLFPYYGVMRLTPLPPPSPNS